MKILYIDPMSSGSLGEYDLRLLNAIKKSHSSEIDIIFASNSLPDSEKDLAGNIDDIYQVFNYASNWPTSKKIWSYILSFFRIFLIFIRHKPEIIHFQWLKIPLLDLFTICVFKLLGARIVYTAHNFLPHKSSFFSFYLYKTACLLVDLVIVHTQDTKVRIIEAFTCKEEKLAVSVHGPLSNDLKLDNSGGELSDDGQFNDDYSSLINLVIVGTARRNKGILEYIMLWAHAHDKYPDLMQQARLTISGSWDQKYLTEVKSVLLDKSIENVYIDNKHLTGHEFSAAIYSSDIAVLPYLEASQSGVLMTLISAQKPFVVSEVGGLSEPLSFGKVGWSFSWLGSLEDRLNQAIILPILDIKQGWQPKKCDWQQIEAKFSWERAAAATVKGYNSLS